MFTKFLIIILFIAQSIFSAQSIKQLLPEDNEISDWKRDAPAELYSKDHLYDYIDGGADIFLEYGFRQVVTQTYAHGDEEIVIDIYEMADADAAFGIYSIRRDPQQPTLDLGDDATLYDYQLSFWQNRYFVVITAFKSDSATQDKLKWFAAVIARKIRRHANPPQLLSLLPEDGLIPRSCCYIRGPLAFNTQFYISPKNVLDLRRNAVDAVSGSYRFDGAEAKFFIVHYPDEAEARAHLDRLLQHFSQNYERISSRPLSLYADAQGNFYAAKCRKNLLLVVANASTITIVEKLLK